MRGTTEESSGRLPTYKVERGSEGEQPAWGHCSLIHLLRTHWVPGTELFCSELVSRAPAPVHRLLGEAGLRTEEGHSGC